MNFNFKEEKLKFTLVRGLVYKNKDEVMKMLNYLTLANFTAWTDKDEMKQGSIDENMMNGIKNSQVFVACISTKYKDSENCMSEINYAKASGKDIVYVNLNRHNKFKSNLNRNPNLQKN